MHHISTPRAFSNAKGFHVTILPKPPSWKVWSEPIRPVALRLPFLYVLSLAGNLMIAKLTSVNGADKVESVGEMPINAGYADMVICGDSLVVPAREGTPAVYSLADPVRPKPISVTRSGETFGAASSYRGYYNYSLVAHRQYVFFAYPGRLSVVDLTRPASPEVTDVQPAVAHPNSL